MIAGVTCLICTGFVLALVALVTPAHRRRRELFLVNYLILLVGTATFLSIYEPTMTALWILIVLPASGIAVIRILVGRLSR